MFRNFFWCAVGVISIAAVPLLAQCTESRVRNLFTITGRMNCALLLAGCKINYFYPKIPPLPNYKKN